MTADAKEWVVEFSYRDPAKRGLHGARTMVLPAASAFEAVVAGYDKMIADTGQAPDLSFIIAHEAVR